MALEALDGALGSRPEDPVRVEPQPALDLGHVRAMRAALEHCLGWDAPAASRATAATQATMLARARPRGESVTVGPSIRIRLFGVAYEVS